MSCNKRTRIIATLAKDSCTKEKVQALFNEGMNVVRINTAHAKIEDTGGMIDIIRGVSPKIGILIDTKGPEIRTGDLGNGIHIEKGARIFLYYASDEPENAEGDVPCIPLNHDALFRSAKIRSHILIDDGSVCLRVEKLEHNGIYCQVEEGVLIKSRKTVNLPDGELDMPSVSERDRLFIEFAAKKNVDFVAHSFVRSAEDVKAVQNVLDEFHSSAQIIAKIENRQGVNHLTEILNEAYGIMVARGDLGVELPGHEVPLVQKKMIRECIQRGKPVIVATQMLESMILNPRPTRAEISDVANAVLDGADVLMLSGETAVGKYPVEAVQEMARIAFHAESHREHISSEAVSTKRNDLRAYMAKAAVRAAEELDAKAILVPARTGTTARLLASFHWYRPVFVAVYTPGLLGRFSMCYGIYPLEIVVKIRSELMEKALEAVHNSGALEKDDRIVSLVSTPGAPNGETNLMEINQLDRCLRAHQHRDHSV